MGHPRAPQISAGCGLDRTQIASASASVAEWFVTELRTASSIGFEIAPPHTVRLRSTQLDDYAAIIWRSARDLPRTRSVKALRRSP